MNTTTQQTEQVQGKAGNEPTHEEINQESLQGLISDAGEDEEENQSDFDAAFGGDGSQPVGDESGKEDKTIGDEKPSGDEKPGDNEKTGEEMGEAKAGEKESPKAEVKADETPSDIENLQKHIRKLEGKFGNINQQMGEFLKKIEGQAEDKGGESPGKAQIRKAMEDSESMSELRTNYPEWAEAIDEQVMAVGAHVLEQIPDQKSMVQEARQMAVLDIKHEGWEDTINEPKFVEWLGDQTSEIRALADSSSGKDAVQLLDKYEEYNNPASTPGTNQDLKQQRVSKKNRLEDAVQPTGGKGKRQVGDTDEQEFLRSFEN